MKPSLCIAVSLGLPLICGAQNYSIPWFKVAGGGGTSTNGQYALSGTIGQPDAGVQMAGGSFALMGGFWTIGAVQSPGAPTLIITSVGAGQVAISWSPPSSQYLLQETWVLNPPNWTNSPSGTNQPVTLPVSSPRKFYRLFKWCEEDC